MVVGTVGSPQLKHNRFWSAVFWQFFYGVPAEVRRSVSKTLAHDSNGCRFSFQCQRLRFTCWLLKLLGRAGVVRKSVWYIIVLYSIPWSIRSSRPVCPCLLPVQILSSWGHFSGYGHGQGIVIFAMVSSSHGRTLIVCILGEFRK